MTISPPKINSEISKILAPNFRDFQELQNSQKIQKIQSFQNVRPYVLEKSRALGLGILEILKFLEIVDFLEIPKFPKSSPLCFGAILSTRSGDFGNFENFGDFGIFGNVGNLGNFGLFGSFGIFCLLHGCVRSREIGLTPVNLGIDFQEGCS